MLTLIVYVVPLSPLTTLSSTVTAHVLPFTEVTHTLTFPLHRRLVPHTVFMLVQLTNVGCTAIFPLHNKLVELTVLMFVPDTNVG